MEKRLWLKIEKRVEVRALSVKDASDGVGEHNPGMHLMVAATTLGYS